MEIMVDDKRTDAEKAETKAYVVGTDSFMSGWGLAPGRSLFAVAITDARGDQDSIVLENMRRRPEMKRVRYNLNLPRLRAGDHLSIVGPDAAERFYQRVLP